MHHSRSRSPPGLPRRSRSSAPVPDRHHRARSVPNRCRSRSPPQAHPNLTRPYTRRKKPSTIQFALDNLSLSSLERSELRSSSAPEEVFYVGEDDTKAQRNYYTSDAGRFVIRHRDHILFRFEISKHLGSGTFGTCLQAYDHKYVDVPAVAIKVVDTGPKLVAAHAPRRLSAEIDILFCRLWDPTPEAPEAPAALVRVLTHGIFRSHIWISMELLGPSLFTFLKEGKRFTEKDLCTAARDLFQALEFIHSRKVIHQDLKLDNVLMSECGTCRVKIVDFGQARVFAGDSRQVTRDGVLGNLWYRAPELLLGLQQYDPTIDVWALALILAEMAQTQHQPKFEGSLFCGRTELEVLCEQTDLLGQPCQVLLREALTTTWNGTAQKLFRLNSSGTDVVWRRPCEFVARRSPHPSFNIIQGRTVDEHLSRFLRDLLAWNPHKRLTATKALEHQFFQPRRSPASTLPVYPVLPQCTPLPVTHVPTLQQHNLRLPPPQPPLPPPLPLPPLPPPLPLPPLPPPLPLPPLPPPPPPPPLAAPPIAIAVPLSPMGQPPSTSAGTSSPELQVVCDEAHDRETTSANPDHWQSTCDSPHWKSCKSCIRHICCLLQGIQAFKTSNAVFPLKQHRLAANESRGPCPIQRRCCQRYSKRYENRLLPDTDQSQYFRSICPSPTLRRCLLVAMKVSSFKPTLHPSPRRRRYASGSSKFDRVTQALIWVFMFLPWRGCVQVLTSCKAHRSRIQEISQAFGTILNGASILRADIFGGIVKVCFKIMRELM